MKTVQPFAKSHENGFTLLEIVIAACVMVLLLGTMNYAYVNGLDLWGANSSLLHAEAHAQARMMDVTIELMESSAENVTVKTFTDAGFPKGPQQAVAFSTARDASNRFQMSAGNPVWQGVMVYCPYHHARDGRQLRRYVHYGSHVFPLDISSISGSTITLSDGTKIQRSGGTVMLDRISSFNVTPGYPLDIHINLDVPTAKGVIPLALTMQISCRNKN
jgi:hypothetical protein